MNQNLRIKKNVLVLHDAPLSEWKGTQRILMEYANYLVMNGFNVTYVSPSRFERPPEEKEIKYNIKINFMVKNIHMRHFLIYFVPKKELDALRPDLIIVSTFNVFPFIPFNKYKVIMGSHVYGPEHEEIGSRYNKLKIRIKRYIFKIVALFYSKKRVAFYSINPTQKSWLIKLLPKKFTVYCQPPPSDCKPFNLINYYELPDKYTILYLGELTYDKGFSDFIKIVEKFNEEKIHENLEFVIGTVGGPLIKDAESLISRFPNVRIISTEEEDVKIHAYHISSILVSPSKVENFHIVTLEAQLCGLPVISSDISGPRSIIENNITGILIEPGNINEFHRALVKYYDLWYKDKNLYYSGMKTNSEKAKRFCKENILPNFLDMVDNELKK